VPASYVSARTSQSHCVTVRSSTVNRLTKVLPPGLIQKKNGPTGAGGASFGGSWTLLLTLLH
jgi:hypothetical protein